MSKVLIILIAVLVAGCGSTGAIFNETDFPARRVTSGGTNYHYRVYVPARRPPDEKIPVMLYLHGGGSRGDDNRSQLAGLPSLIREHPELFPYVIVFPQCAAGKFWSGEMNQQALAALDQTVEEFNGDEKRIYLAGFSMGANGTWQNGLLHPGKFAALVPIAGDVAPRSKLSDEVLVSLPPRLREAAVSQDPYQVFAKGIGDTAVWVFHGTDDDAVPVSESRRIMEAFRNAGKMNMRYTEYEDEGHLIAARALGEPELSKWLAQQQSN